MADISLLDRLKALPLKLAVRGGATAIASRFERRNPFAAQSTIFGHLLRRGAATRFGKDYGLAELSGKSFQNSYRLYRNRVPIRTYADFWRDYFCTGYAEHDGNRTLSLTDVTWPGKTSFFCETSGTTAPTKFIPFSREMFAANKQAARDLAACYLARNRTSRLLPGKL